MRCDTWWYYIKSEIAVSIHTPTWGVTIGLTIRFFKAVFQSTHLHEVWQCNIFSLTISIVSIHTPTWGVTGGSESYGDGTVVSIHTPTWGVTPVPLIPLLKDASFNPHTYMRCDLRVATTNIINIVFQSTHLHEVWRIVRANVRHNIRFQSTHLHEVWLVITLFPRIPFGFQSTHLHEVWQFAPGITHEPTEVSIHTPTWGVTRFDHTDGDPDKVSIHTPTWGVTMYSGIGWKWHYCFNPHTYMRCDCTVVN